jgi:thioredoxin 1
MNKFCTAFLLICSLQSLYGLESKEPEYLTTKNSVISSVVYLSDDEFETAIQEGYSIVDFYADWCGPCKNLSPIFEKVSGEIDSLKFFKLNIDEFDLSTTKYEIQFIPTLILFKDGNEIARRVGSCNETQLNEFITVELVK